MLKWIGGVSGCLTLALTASAVSADAATVGTPVADLNGRVGKIAAYAEVLAWNHYNASDATFSLVVQVGDQRPRRLDVAPRNRPFDVDVGPDRDGEPALVYSRCRREPKQRSTQSLNAFFGLPRYPGGSGCDIYHYSLAAARERRLGDISTRREEEFMPSLWRGRVAFVRQYSSGRPLVLYFNTRRGNRSHRLHSTQVADNIASLDLRGRRASYLTARFIGACERSNTAEVSDNGFKMYVSLVELGRKPDVLAHSCSHDARQSRLAGPVWSNSTLIYNARRGRDRGRGVTVARLHDGSRRILSTYTSPNLYDRYIAANDRGIYAAAFSQGQALLSRLLDSP